MLFFCKLALIIALNVLCALCYIPAVPSNNTAQAITAGLNVTDVSTLNLYWFSTGFVVSVLVIFIQSSDIYIAQILLRECVFPVGG